MDIDFILQEYDDFVGMRDYERGGEFLELAAEAAGQEGDAHAELIVLNELIGHYRKNDDKEKCLVAIDKTLKAIEEYGSGCELCVGTAYINIGTGYTRFGNPKLALQFFEKAEEIYSVLLNPRDPKWGGLLNNAAAAYEAAGDYAEAKERFERAFRLMSALDKNEDAAVSLVNLAELAELTGSSDMIKSYLDRAYYLLDIVRERGGYYAFLCEKCAPAFLHFGDEKRGEKLLQRAAAIYEENSK